MPSSSPYLIPSPSGSGYRFRSIDDLCLFADISAPYSKCKAYAPRARNVPHCSRPINRHNQHSVPQIVADLLDVTIPSIAASHLLVKLSSCVVCGVTSWHQPKAGDVYQEWVKKLWREYLRACGVDLVVDVPVQFTQEAWDAAVPRPTASPVVASPVVSITPAPVVARMPAAVDAATAVAVVPAAPASRDYTTSASACTLALAQQPQQVAVAPPNAARIVAHPVPQRTFAVFADPVNAQNPVAPRPVTGRALQRLDANVSTRTRTESQSTCPLSAGDNDSKDASVNSSSQDLSVPKTCSRNSSQKHNSPVVTVVCVGEESSDEECLLTPESSDIDDDDISDSEFSEDSGDEDTSADEDSVVVENNDELEERSLSDAEDTGEESDEDEDSEATESLILSRTPSHTPFPTTQPTFFSFALKKPHQQLKDILHTMTQTVGLKRRHGGYIYAFKRPSNPELLKIGYTGFTSQHFDPVAYRLEQWERQCVQPAVEVFRVEVPMAVERIECLVHQTLREERRVEAPCGPCSARKGSEKQHDEWFEAGVAEAKSVVEAWAEWAAERPYDVLGRPTDFWASRMDEMREEVKEGDEPGEWLEGMGELIEESRLWGFSQVTPVDHSGDEGEED